MASTICPDCKAAVGELCRLRDPRSRRGAGRPILHSERRQAWQQANPWQRVDAGGKVRGRYATQGAAEKACIAGDTIRRAE